MDEISCNKEPAEKILEFKLGGVRISLILERTEEKSSRVWNNIFIEIEKNLVGS